MSNTGLGRREPARGPIRRLDALARGALPTAAAATLMVLASAVPGLPSLVPAIAVASVFFWSLFRPAAMPAPAAFGLGLLQDLLGFAPLGIGVLVLLLVHGGTLRARPFLAKQPFPIVWLAQCAVAAAAVALGFALHALLGWQLPPTVLATTQLGLAVGLYPLLALPMTLTHRAMQRAEALA